MGKLPYRPDSWYRRLTLQSPSWLRRFSHASRYRTGARLVRPKPGDRVLDYGTGDAELLIRLATQQPMAEYVGFELMESMRKLARENISAASAQIEICSTYEELDGRQFDWVCCMEVLEHLPDDVLMPALQTCVSMLKPGGRLVVSVPVEIGLPALAKAVVRRLTRSHGLVRWRDVFLCMMGRPHLVSRPAGRYIPSHIGFDYRRIRGLLSASRLSVIYTEFTPIHILRGFLNSQVFFIAVRR